MKEQIENIKAKLQKLASIDTKLQLFGASTHKYNLQPTLTTQAVQAFEALHNVSLPEGYAAFLTQVGNGGAGPFYGLKPLEDGTILFKGKSSAEDIKLDLSKPFPHTISWNVDEDELEDLHDKIEDAADAGNTKLEQELYEQKWKMISEAHHDYGRLNLADYGRGVHISLIVNGPQAGFMWTDDRANDGGIYPSNELGNFTKISFLDWYELWLDEGIKEIEIRNAEQPA